jgi:hypothetical protein
MAGYLMTLRQIRGLCINPEVIIAQNHKLEERKRSLPVSACCPICLDGFLEV